MIKPLLALGLSLALASSACAVGPISGGGSSGSGLTTGTVTTADATADNIFAPTGAAKKPFVLQLAPSQTANGFEIQSSAGAILFGVSSAGVVTTANGTLLNNMTDTWNNAGTQFDAIKMNVTNTASNALSRFVDLQAGGVPYFRLNISKAFQMFNTYTDDNNYERGGMWWSGNTLNIGTESLGTGTGRNVYINTKNKQWTFNDSNGVFSSANSVSTYAGGYYGWLGRGEIYSSASNAIEFYSTGAGGFAKTTSLYERYGTGSPEGAVTAPVGTAFHRTDGSAGTSFYVKESGTGNTGWVAK